MAEQVIAVVLHGITGRMMHVAHQALKQINASGGIRIEDHVFKTVPIGLGRDRTKLEA